MEKESKICAFCDEPADTREHVIPKWLQSRYNLMNQRLSLWNKTTIPYRQAIIPACRYCNSERFSRLESKVESGRANRQDYFLWALKIRYGLAIRDFTLLLDRKRPERGSLLPREVAEVSSKFIKHAFLALDKPGFRFHPNPFGSVFLMNQSKQMEGEFSLVDVPPPYWALGIVVPPNKILVVLFADRGVVHRFMTKHFGGLLRNLSQYVQGLDPLLLTFRLLRYQNFLVIPSGVRLKENGIRSAQITRKIKTRARKLDWYIEIAKMCGGDETIAKEAYERDAWMDEYSWVKI